MGYKNDLLLVLSGKDPSNDNTERFSLTPTVVNNILDDQYLFGPEEDTNQAEMEDYDPADHARAPAQVQIDNLEGTFGAQTATVFASPDEAALVKRLKDLARKHEEVSVC